MLPRNIIRPEYCHNGVSSHVKSKARRHFFAFNLLNTNVSFFGEHVKFPFFFFEKADYLEETCYTRTWHIALRRGRMSSFASHRIEIRISYLKIPLRSLKIFYLLSWICESLSYLTAVLGNRLMSA